jgi:hypothetical protein
MFFANAKPTEDARDLLKHGDDLQDLFKKATLAGLVGPVHSLSSA